MKVEMVMPQMGESIAEGTIVRWTRQVGDVVAKDENILDISTDKVDSEIPSPAAGKLVEIRAKEGETIPVGQVIAIIETEAGAAAAPAAAGGGPGESRQAEPAPAPAPAPAQATPAPVAAGGKQAASAPPAAQSATVPGGLERETSQGPSPGGDEPSPPPRAGGPEEFRATAGRAGQAAAASAPGAGAAPPLDAGEVPRHDGDRFYSPLVRSIARTEGISSRELASVPGTGRGGRVTRDDLLSYLDARRSGRGPSGGTGAGAGAAAGAQAPAAAASAAPARGAASAAPGPVAGPAAAFEAIPGVAFSGLAAGTEVKFRPYPAYTVAESRGTPEGAVDVVKMDNVRQRIAEHMVRSKATSPHVASVTEVDMTRIVRRREATKAEFEARHGIKLTYTPFIVMAAVRALLDYPMMNASVDGTDILVKRYVNIGVAVALDAGLIVPVVKHAEEKNFLGVARAIQDLAARARGKKLLPDDVAGGTFAVTNMGSFGNLFGIPIINQPNVGILGAGAIVKRPVVVGDAIAVRDIMYLSLSYDHRIVDGALGGYFIQRVRHYLERVDLAEGV